MHNYKTGHWSFLYLLLLWDWFPHFCPYVYAFVITKLVHWYFLYLLQQLWDWFTHLFPVYLLVQRFLVLRCLHVHKILHQLMSHHICNIIKQCIWTAFFFFFFFQLKSIDIFLISAWKHMIWVLIWGACNEYPQHMFSCRNKKNIIWIPPLIWSYDLQKYVE